MTARGTGAGASARVALVTAIALTTACSRGPAKESSSPGASSVAGPAGAAAIAGYRGELPPLPQVQFASARPAPITRAAYEFAARHPEVMRYMPCYCGCEKHGHNHAEDCFVSKREADGRPVWNPHGIGCGICIDVAREAARLHKAGVPLEDVRGAIERRYRTEYPTSTPTPKVPPGSAHE